MKTGLLSILLLFSLTLFSQKSVDVKDLEAKRKAALAEIEATSKLLNQTKSSQKSILNRINLINQQINTRKEVIVLLNQEIGALDKELDNTTLTIQSLEQEYEKKKDKYASVLRKMQRHDGIQDQLIFILSADNLAQSYRRFRYLKEYSDWQKLQAEELIQKQKEISDQREKIKKTLQGKTDLLQSREVETSKLQNEESSKKIEVQDLQKKEKTLKEELDQKKKLAQTLNRQIEKAIEEEIARSRREQEAAAKAAAEKAAAAKEALAKEAAKKETKETAKKETKKESSKKSSAKKTEKAPEVETTPEIVETRVAETEGGYAMTREERTLSSGFANNRGKLPFPLKGNYKIIGRFGQHQHQDLKNIQVNSNGIDLQTSSNNNALSVFNGVVSKVFTLAGANTVVIIRHGNYLTVYSNLSDVYVKTGDSVKTGQTIGKIYTDTEENNSTILHFEVWKETSKLNPEDWLN